MKYNLTFRRNDVVTIEVPQPITNTAQLTGLERELNAKVDQANGPAIEVISWEVVPEEVGGVQTEAPNPPTGEEGL